ncbi:hypothetical protein [Dyadobacter psychrophilus]|uniref:Uncharacterized protein n=1 Tax=Dyadobacter psychrophilus TaxID=651661 RepID=A0A1T5HG41_9BACT|nr:hypothetical protein [Dyadobacter psychrophilus]SKC19604.1 hypothetical protein SAMN05660293_05495 [Dyadobacter psychrophilus]
MKASIYVGYEEIGKTNFSVTDESMGAIGGNLFPNENYEKYKHQIQRHFDKKGISNIEDLNYRIVLEDNTELKPSGGIGIIDCVDFSEILVESAGLDLSKILNKLKDADGIN